MQQKELLDEPIITEKVHLVLPITTESEIQRERARLRFTRLLLIVAVVMLITIITKPSRAGLYLGQTQDKQADQNKVGSKSLDEQEIIKLETELVRAGLRGDAATTDRLMADEYFFMTRNGTVYENLKASLLVKMKSGESKVDLLASLEPGESDEPKPHPANIENALVHVYGDTGVAIVRSTYQSRSKEGGIIEVPTRFMHVWSRQHGRWQLVAGSSTRIEPSRQ